MLQKLHTYREKNYLQWNVFTFAGILLIVVCGINVTWGLERYMDVLFWDEALYLHRGLGLFEHVPKTWGPSYSLWYKFLSFIIPDRVDLYYFNFKLTTILVSIAFFLLLLASGVQRVLAFILAVFFLSSYINLPLWPRISHFCVIILVAGIIVAKYRDTLAGKFIVYSLALLVCSYARPELFLAFLCCFAAAFFFFLTNLKNNSKVDWGLMIILTTVCIFLYIFFKTPFNNGDTGRGLRVFLQHFAWNYTEWNKLYNVFWLDFPDLIKEQFIDSSSLEGIIQSNPEMFQRHIFSNISNYFIETGKVVLSFFAPIFTKDIHWLCGMVSVMLFTVYFSFTKSFKNKRQRFFALVKDNFCTLLVIALFALPSFIASIYAYPRLHYIMLQVPLFLLVLALLISSIRVGIEKSVQKITVIAVVAFFVMPAAEDFVYFDLFRQEKSMSNVRTLEYMKRNITAKDSIRVFDVEGYVTNLLPPNFTNYNDVYYRNRNIVLSDFIREKNIDIIYKTPSLVMLNNVQNDTTLFDLFRNPAKYGFFEQKTGNFAPVLLIRKK